MHQGVPPRLGVFHEFAGDVEVQGESVEEVGELWQGSGSSRQVGHLGGRALALLAQHRLHLGLLQEVRIGLAQVAAGAMGAMASDARC